MPFLDSLAKELAPTPGRLAATLRIVVACVVGTTLVMTLQMPFGYYVILTIFVVSLTDSGASLSRALLRYLGTLAGGVVGILFLIITIDRPWLRVPLLGPVAAFFVFLSQTSTVPYFGLLGGITALIIITAPVGDDVAAALDHGLWRIALVALGSAIASAAQLVLWPSDPEALLLGSLTERLRAVRDFVARRLEEPTPPATRARLESLALSGLTKQVELLTNAEARHASMRHRHEEQVALIAGVELLLVSAVAWTHAEAAGAAPLPESARQRLRDVGAGAGRLADALEARRAVAEVAPAPRSDEAVAAAGGAAFLPALVDMERALAGLARAAASLAAADDEPVALRSPLDILGVGRFLTPAATFSNWDAIAFSLKTGLAATIAYVIYEGLAWPGISTCILTTIVAAQATFGATINKLVLRTVAAALGGLLGLLVILTTAPNFDTLPPLLGAVALGMGIAAWITVGSERIAYAGRQVGLALSLCIIGDLGPTTNLEPARDRVIGVLLGGAVVALVYYLLRPVFAASEMRHALARSLRSLATLSRIGLAGPVDLVAARGHRWQVYQDVATTLRLHDESKFEPGAGTPEARAERAWVTRLTTGVQSVFLALLAVVRHRIDVDLSTLPPAVREPLRAVGEGVTLTLDRVADRVDGVGATPAPALAALLTRAAAAVETVDVADPRLAAHLRGRLSSYRELVGQLERVTDDAMAHGAAPTVVLQPAVEGEPCPTSP